MKRLTSRKLRRLSKKIFSTRLKPLPRRERLNLKPRKIIREKILPKLMMSSNRSTHNLHSNLLKMINQKMKRQRRKTRNLCLARVFRLQTPSKVKATSLLIKARANAKKSKMSKIKLNSPRVYPLRVLPKADLKFLLPVKRAKIKKYLMKTQNMSLPKICLLMTSPKIYLKALRSKRVKPKMIRRKS